MADTSADIVHRLTGRVHRLIARITGDPEEARDLTQDVLVRVLSRAHGIEDPARLDAYILRSAYHMALNANRGRKRRSETHAFWADNLSGATASDPAPPSATHQRSEEIRTAIFGLADRQREVVTLRFYGGLTLAQIAADLKISEGSVKVHMARALHNLKTVLAPVAGKES